MSDIERLAFDLLDERELRLADHLHLLLGDDKWDAGPLIEEILPIYSERIGDSFRNCYPRNIYRPLYYIHSWSSGGDFKNSTRTYIDVISNHIEGCLQNFFKPLNEYRAMSKAFGPLVARLKECGILSTELADHLWKFNEFITEGSIRVLNNPVQLSKRQPKIGVAPELGQHTDEVLGELGYSETEIADLRKQEVI